MTPTEKRDALVLLRSAMDVIEALPEERPCRKCDHFAGGNCLRWEQAVPVEHQAVGCDQWENIVVPF